MRFAPYARAAVFLVHCLPLLLADLAIAGAIYPIDRAQILVGSRFDFKVEFDRMVPRDSIRVTVNGVDSSTILGKAVQFLEDDDGANASALVARDVSVRAPGHYVVEASNAGQTLRVEWDVYDTGVRKAKNVILFIGDGLSVANRTAARMLSKGLKEGKYYGQLAFDDMPHMALIGTSGVDSIITDSANAMSAYTTGHKSSVNALGVYVARNKDNLAHPRVETITELVKRNTSMAVGIVTDAEIQDATPAGMFAHTRRRSDKDIITEQLLLSRADVILGGGSAYFLPQTTPGSKRKDASNFVELFRRVGFRIVTDDNGLKTAAADPSTTQLLGLFHPENMDGALDRYFLKKGTVGQFPNQPDLTDMTRAALAVLSRNADGFVLMVEAGLIDKYNHPLDWERSVYDTIMLSNAVQVAKDWAAARDDTLIIVTPDHTHGVSIVGTVDDSKPGPEMRDKVGVYSDAGFPNYPPPNASGYPERVDVSRRLAMFYGNFPDYYETFRPKLDDPFVPSVRNDKVYIANQKYTDQPGAMLRTGNLPRSADTGTHTMDDAVLTASGPGSEAFHGFMENVAVFRVMVDALGLGRAGPAGTPVAGARSAALVTAKPQSDVRGGDER
jgi:alkaline phosphatase